MDQPTPLHQPNLADLLDRLNALLRRRLEAERDERLCTPYRTPAEIAAALDISLDDGRSPMSLDALFEALEKMLEYAPATASPTYVNSLWSGRQPVALVADLLVRRSCRFTLSLSHTSLNRVSSAPSGHFCECLCLHVQRLFSF